MSIGIGIVGAGMISNFHAKAIADTRDGKLIGCYDRSVERAEQFASANDCKSYATLEDMLADPDVQAVAICTPSGAHLEPAVAAANAGKHVMVEKPLEVTTEKCDAIIAACDAANVKLAATFQSRFHESSQLMKSAVDAGRFGKITMGDAYVKWYRSQEYYDSGAWRGTWALDGGGALMNQAIHSVDLLLWLMGPAKRVHAMMDTLTHERIEVEDIVIANIQFENGALGVVEATTTAFPGALKRVEIAGSEGSAVLEEEDLTQWTFAKESDEDASIRDRMAGKTETGGGASDPAAIGHHGHTEVFNDFLEAIQSDREPLVNGVEGRRSIELICAIYESARTGKTIEL
ncbi:Gfo/Idh/MocA family protein [Aporhodopirellula aestuarii]|uniref:Gfo/Idh/MocA family oxidoreductase n=1 Tax=Aporhodopirellula aestuarii TaxID=2950107 RepID=A0ABT0UB24_9BACT|nr:Gfo/Idh/MocA family oxidoreductase [Aporhodopirellula aestuarii]MCM2374012.1 Gfo/Idh/MocA family oxidoreductase [Aporhodopirellula aestuarii]